MKKLASFRQRNFVQSVDRVEDDAALMDEFEHRDSGTKASWSANIRSFLAWLRRQNVRGLIRLTDEPWVRLTGKQILLVWMPLVVFLMWVFVDVQPYPVYWLIWSFRGRGDIVDPRMVMGCDSDAGSNLRIFNHSKTYGTSLQPRTAVQTAYPVVVVIPLIWSQTNRLMKTLGSWTEPSVWPACNVLPYEKAFDQRGGESGKKPALLIWFDIALTDPKMEAALLKVESLMTVQDEQSSIYKSVTTANEHQRMIRTILKDSTGDPSEPKSSSATTMPSIPALLFECFDHVIISSANLTMAETRNSYWMHPLYSIPRTEGSNAQFYRLFKFQTILDQFQYMFLMEPDTYPIRPGWLDIIPIQTIQPPQVSRFWVKGAVMNYDQRFNIAWEPWRKYYQRHINGNAMYILNNSCFNAFLDHMQVISQGLCTFWAYDTCINIYRHSMQCLNLYHATAMRFVYTDFVAHIGIIDVPIDDLRNKVVPNVFLVHGKYHLIKSNL